MEQTKELVFKPEQSDQSTVTCHDVFSGILGKIERDYGKNKCFHSYVTFKCIKPFEILEVELFGYKREV